MNKRRRATLNKALDELTKLKNVSSAEDASAIVETARDLIEVCSDDEEMAKDSLPESLQWSAAATNMEDNVSDMADAISELEIIQEDIAERENYSYQDISKQISLVFNLIRQTIHR